ncbi:hypothetical protein GCM10017687_69330 [Streptomyces echinatus]
MTTASSTSQSVFTEPRGTSTVSCGPDDRVRRLEEDDRLEGRLHPRLAGVVVVVEADADDLPDPAERGSDAQPGRVQHGQLTGLGRRPHPAERGGVGEERAVDVVHEARQVPQGPVGVEQRGALGPGRTDSQQLHGHNLPRSRAPDRWVQPSEDWLILQSPGPVRKTLFTYWTVTPTAQRYGTPCSAVRHALLSGTAGPVPPRSRPYW